MSTARSRGYESRDFHVRGTGDVLIKLQLSLCAIRPSFVDTLFPVLRPHPCKPAEWNVIIGDYYYEYH